MKKYLILGLALCLIVIGKVGAEAELVGWWRFNEGSGTSAADSSGKGNTGTLYNSPTWVSQPSGYAIKFDGTNDYIGCGAGTSLNATDEITIAAWVKADSVITNNADTGIVEKATLIYALTRHEGVTVNDLIQGYVVSSAYEPRARVPELDTWQFVTLTFNRNLGSQQAKFYINGFLKDYVNCTDQIPTNANPVEIGRHSTQYFHGTLDEIRIYTNALSAADIMGLYWLEAGNKGKDTSNYNKIVLTPYLNFQTKVKTEADFTGILPVPSGNTITIQFGVPGQTPLETKTVGTIPDSGKDYFDFKSANLAAATYEVRAIQKNSGGQTVTEDATAFWYPPAVEDVPSPAQKTLGSIPAEPSVTSYTYNLTNGGGFTMTVGSDTCCIESTYSYPNTQGKENRLIAAASKYTGGEGAGWTVTKTSSTTLTAQGAYYKIDRTLYPNSGRINVTDLITNKSSTTDRAIIIGNNINIVGKGITQAYIGGDFINIISQGTDTSIKYDPTIFLKKSTLGLGLLPLDDVYILQSKANVNQTAPKVYTDQFAIAKSATYTVEWAVYPVASASYYDFINQVRNDEGRNDTTVGGSLTAHDRRSTPDQRFVADRGLKYLNLSALNQVADDTQISYDGIEFVNQAATQELSLLTTQLADIHSRHPQLKGFFHIAHSVYATNASPTVFTDSRVTDSAGKLVMYNSESWYQGNNGYFSALRVSQGWRFYTYYPTSTNSFGTSLLNSVNIMMDQVGSKGVFMDGLMHGYASEWTYAVWDNHSADINMSNYSISQKKGSVQYLSQPVLVTFCRNINTKGGVLISHNSGIFTRTICAEKYIVYDEVETRLAPSPIKLGGPDAIVNEIDTYMNAYNRLNKGFLSFYYGEIVGTHESVISKMYPITVKRVYSGYVRGGERIVTTKTGLYGWQGNTDVHFAYLWNGAGYDNVNYFLTSVGTSEIRTEIDQLNKNEIAIIRKIPITISTSATVNMITHKYDEDGIEFTLNGSGSVTVSIRNGDFQIKPNTVYTVTTNLTTDQLTSNAQSVLSIPLTLATGQTKITVIERGTENEKAESGLAGYWGFDEGTGTVAADYCGYEDYGYIEPKATPTWVPQPSGCALKFDGTDYVDCGAGERLDITDAITVEAWINADDVTSSNSDTGIVMKPSYIYGLTRHEGAGANHYVYGYINGIAQALYVTIELKKWQHIVLTYDKSLATQNIKLYVNGSLRNYANYTTPINVTTNPLYIGRNSAQYFHGQIDEVKIYNRALSLAEIQASYGAKEKELVGYWSLDEATGTVATDYSGYGNTGTIYGSPAWVPQPSGSTIRFDGTNDYIDCGAGTSLDATDAVSVEAWINADDVVTGNGDTGVVIKPSYIYGITRDQRSGAGTNKTIYAYVNGVGQMIYTTIELGKWQHVVLTYDKSLASQNMKLYVNGSLKSTLNYTTSISTTTNHLYIGKNSTQYFSGMIDEPRIYTRALSESEIVARYKARDKGSVGYWNLDEATGTVATDSSGYGNTGTIYGNPARAPQTSGSAIKFDGTDDYVDCGAGTSLDATSAVSVEAWINADDVTTGNSDTGVVIKPSYIYGITRDQRSGAGTNKYIYGYINGVGQLLYTSIDLGKWQHVVLTYDMTLPSQNMKLYLNGSLKSTLNYTTALTVTTNHVYIGKNSAQYFNGMIDEARVYNRALSAAEILAKYNARDKGSVGNWNLDEGSGSLANDSSGYKNYGTIYGSPAWVSQPSGSAVRFDGTNDYVDCGAGTSLDITDAITVEAWINADNVTSSNSDTGVVLKPSYIYGITRSESSGANNYIYAYINGVGQAISTTIDLGKWQHIVLTYDKSLGSQNMKLYVNGSVRSTLNYTTPISITTNPVYIGKNSTQYFHGIIDEARIYNRALSDSEILASYNAKEKGRVGYWNLEEGSGTVAKDSSGYENTGTVYGSAAWVSQPSGFAVTFDGTDDYVDCGAGTSLDLTDAVSVEAWINADDVTSSNSDTGVVIKPSYIYGITRDERSGANQYIYGYINGTGQLLYTTIVKGQWQHVVLTYDKSLASQNIKLYVNGSLRSSLNYTTSISTTTNHLYIGKNSLQYFHGKIDEVNVYDRALSETEIIAKYQNYQQ